MNSPISTAIAAHRFGLGEADLAVVGADASAWLLAQIGPAEPQRGSGLVTGAQGLARQAEVVLAQRQPAMADAATPAALAMPLRDIAQADVRARLATAAASQQPFNEPLALFWANHFTVSLANATPPGTAAAIQRQSLPPHSGSRT